jgi:hypothetical protein
MRRGKKRRLATENWDPKAKEIKKRISNFK